MRRSEYTDSHGRRVAVWIPDGVPDSDASLALPIGPPPLTSLELPLETEVRLHNELFARNVLTAADARSKRAEIVNALQAAFRVDAERIYTAYLESESVYVHNQNDLAEPLAAEETGRPGGKK